MRDRQCADYTRAALHAVVKLAIFACTLLILPVSAEPASYKIDPAQTRIEYGVVEFGFIEQHGRFGQVQGVLMLDAEARTGHIDFVIDATSVETGWSLRDAFVRGEPMLDVEHHREIRFQSTRVEWDGERPARIHGMLTMRGVARPIVLTLKSFACDAGANAGTEVCRAVGVATIQRSKFEMTAYVPLVSDEVALDVDVTATRDR